MSEKPESKIVRVDAETHRKVRVMAAERDKSMGEVLRDAIRKAWEDKDDQPRR